MARLVSIIVPTYREAANLDALTRRVFAALTRAGITGELIVVDDDSRDGTAEIVATLAREYPVRLLVRRNEKGLSSAVLAGFAQARYDRFVVMDADLQHPPEVIPEFVKRLEEGECDFVLGTRYVAGGRIAADWSWPRRLASRMATLLARPLAPISDPMSGFFALNREVWDGADRLNPVGYKIGLELYVKGRCCRPAEVPIDFALRTAGESKFGLRQQWQYARHLWRLYRYRYPLWFWSTLLVLVATMGLGVISVVD
jgi:dolichol-phosphate mannosyltransferase